MNMSKNKLFPLNSASDRLVTEIVINDCKYMKIIDMNCGCRNEYVSDLHPLFRSLLQRSLSYLLLYPQFTYMIFIYLQALYYHLTGLWNQHNDQLPVALLAQLVARCTSIVEVMGSSPVQA